MGKPVALLLSEGQMSDYKGAALLLPVLPKAKELLGDRGYDADWFRAALREKGITPCIPPKKNRKTRIEYDRELYKQRHKVENMFARLKDWRRIAMRYDRCAPHLLLRHLYRRYRHLLSQLMSPEPRSNFHDFLSDKRRF
jgi:putative transposase